MNKDELMKMACEVGGKHVVISGMFCKDYQELRLSIEALDRFACAIIERAAVGCEEEPFANHPHIIRALKPQLDNPCN